MTGNRDGHASASSPNIGLEPGIAATKPAGGPPRRVSIIRFTFGFHRDTVKAAQVTDVPRVATYVPVPSGSDLHGDQQLTRRLLDRERAVRPELAQQGAQIRGGRTVGLPLRART